MPASVILSPNLSPDTKQASPLVSPLLNDQPCPRTDDEEEGRRKVWGLVHTSVLFFFFFIVMYITKFALLTIFKNAA